MYVITGCGGSGTGWASQLMTGLGSPCGHEQVYTHLGRVSAGTYEGDASWFAVPMLAKDEPSVCLMRDPLAAVRSITGTRTLRDASFYSARYVMEHLPQIQEAPDLLGRAIRYVSWWDRDIAERLPLFRIEDADPNNVVTLFVYLTGRHPETSVVDTLGALGTDVNSHGGDRSTITWKQVRDHPDGELLIEKAQRFGYPTEDEDHGEPAAAT